MEQRPGRRQWRQGGSRGGARGNHEVEARSVKTHVHVKAAQPTAVKPTRKEPKVSTSHGTKAAQEAGDIEWKNTATAHPTGELPITRM
eukprot:scaffold9694_cov101-Isochrysis_galbana.AAC.1